MFPMIDWSISIGNMATLVTIVIGGIYALSNTRERIFFELAGLKDTMEFVEKRQDALNEAFKQLSDILTKVAVQDSRLGMLEKSVDELRHGRGFIRPIDK